MDNPQEMSNGQVLLIIAFLLLLFGVVGRWDYEDALATAHAAAQASSRALVCEENADNTTFGHSQINPSIVNVANQRFTEQAEELFVLSCIVVTD